MILQEFLGIEFPIIQAPMAGVQGSALAVAVSNAGGHRGIFLSADLSTQVGTIALVSQIVRTVKVPVIAAGGIADGKGIAAAMALGAAGVQIGTACMLCAEATTTAVHRAALKSDAARVWRVAKSRKEAI